MVPTMNIDITHSTTIWFTDIRVSQYRSLFCRRRRLRGISCHTRHRRSRATGRQGCRARNTSRDGAMGATYLSSSALPQPQLPRSRQRPRLTQTPLLWGLGRLGRLG